MSATEIDCTIAEAAEMLEVLTEADDAVMIWGAPGLGKSAIVWQLGDKQRPQGHRVSRQPARAGRRARHPGA